MFYDRFDHAILSFFTIDMLARPFTVEERSGEWVVRQGGRTIGLIAQVEPRMYLAEKMVAIRG